MKLKKQIQPGHLITGLLCCSILFALAGCKSAAAKKAEAPDPEAQAVCTAAAPDAVAAAETAAPADTKTKKQKRSKPAGEVPVEKGPGDGAPPRDQMNAAVDAMESSLAPLAAVPAVSPE